MTIRSTLVGPQPFWGWHTYRTKNYEIKSSWRYRKRKYGYKAGGYIHRKSMGELYHPNSVYKSFLIMTVNIGGQVDKWGVGAHPIKGITHLLPQVGITERVEYHHFNVIIPMPLIWILLQNGII